MKSTSKEDQLHQTIANIYEAAIASGSWAAAVDEFRQLFDGAGANIFRIDQSQQLVTWHSVGLEPDGSEYGEHIYAIDPRVHWAANAPSGALCWDYRFTTDREMDNHAFYDWIEQKSNVRYFIGAHYLLDDGTTLYAAVNRGARQGHVDETDVSRFELLAPHIRNAISLSTQLAPTKSRASLYDLLDLRGTKGLILLSADGRIVETNTEADRILGQNDGLAAADGYLRANKAADTRHLRQLVSSAAAAAAGSGGAISLMRPSGALSYLLRVTPWPLHLDGTPETIAAAVLVTDPEHLSRRPDRADLQAFLGLSVREAELAVHLSQGKSRSEAAAAMGISANTARVHLTNIFEKTGVSSQSDLLRLLLSIP